MTWWLARRISSKYYPTPTILITGLGFGYALIHVESRYVEVLCLVSCLLCFHLAGVLIAHIRAQPAAVPRGRSIEGAMAALLMVSFSGYPAKHTARDIVRGYPSTFRTLAARLRSEGCEGPMASNDWAFGLYTT